MKIGYHRQELLAKLFKTVIFFIVGLAFLLPLFWMISASLKTPAEMFAKDFKWIPANPQWKNYKQVWTDAEVNMTNGFINSGIISVSSICWSLQSIII